MLDILAVHGLCLRCAFCGKAERLGLGEPVLAIKARLSHCFAEGVTEHVVLLTGMPSDQGWIDNLYMTTIGRLESVVS